MEELKLGCGIKFWEMCQNKEGSVRIGEWSQNERDGIEAIVRLSGEDIERVWEEDVGVGKMRGE